MAQIYPNILYLHSHDTGRYVQPYGYPVPTPHIQELAEQGKTGCASPMILYSTVRYFHLLGLISMIQINSRLPNQQVWRKELQGRGEES